MYIYIYTYMYTKNSLGGGAHNLREVLGADRVAHQPRHFFIMIFKNSVKCILVR